MTNKEIGDISENFACSFLERNGYQILERNYRFKRAEIDIIAKYQGILIFVEVKSRSGGYFGEPENNITPKKEGLIIDAANRYMESKSYQWAIRFDVISIILDNFKRPIELRHIPDAFF